MSCTLQRYSSYLRHYVFKMQSFVIVPFLFISGLSSPQCLIIHIFIRFLFIYIFKDYLVPPLVHLFSSTEHTRLPFFFLCIFNLHEFPFSPFVFFSSYPFCKSNAIHTLLAFLLYIFSNYTSFPLIFLFL